MLTRRPANLSDKDVCENCRRDVIATNYYDGLGWKHKETNDRQCFMFATVKAISAEPQPDRPSPTDVTRGV